MPQVFTFLVIAAVAIISTASLVTSERYVRQAGQPGMPGGSSTGGAGGSGGGNGGSGGYGGSGGAPGAPGLPGYDGDDDLKFSLSDFSDLFTSAGERTPSRDKHHKVVVNKECANVDGVADFVNSTTRQSKKAWKALLLRLSSTGNKVCAENLAEQLLSLK